MRPIFPLSALCLVFALAVLCGADSEAQSLAENPEVVTNLGTVPVDYVRDVSPILRSRCATCHNAAEAGGELRLDTAAEVMKGGQNGVAILPGNSGESRLLQAVLQTGELKMPPPDEAKPLEEAQIAILRRWIDEGAVVPAHELPMIHWAFQKPVRPVVPLVSAADISAEKSSSAQTSEINPIDSFIAQRHFQQQLKPLPVASTDVQLRRVYLDLIGLPPTPAQLQAFLNDRSPTAWGKVVDELLASPHYGERWGRHWMDVWRYSDWDGYGAEVRESKPHIWRWRDWIIESLNDDKPYDRMIIEMLAADEIAPHDAQAIRATGFLVRNWYLFNRNTWIDNTVEHTGKAFMGITLNCARCHDHMYDPISQAEYYQFRAFFEPHDIRTDRLPGQSDVSKDGLVRVFDANAGAATLLFIRGDEKNPLKDKPLLAQGPAALGSSQLAIHQVELPPTAYYPGLQSFVAAETLRSAEVESENSAAALLISQQAVATAQAQLLAFQQATATTPVSAPFLTDDFSAARPNIWGVGMGNWQYQDGRLSQLDSADTMCSMKTQEPHPSNFMARLKFRPTGGDVYKSVGISFDASDDQNFSFVYASAGSSKVQVAQRINGVDQYPPDAAKDILVDLNRDHELLVTVRGTQVEVTFNSEAVLTYVLPNRRPAQGQFHIWTYDATAEFLSLEIMSDAILSEADLLAAVQGAESTAKVSGNKMTVASAALDFTKMRIAADQANYAMPPAANSKELSLAAGKAERTLAVHQEELKLLTAEQILMIAKAALPVDGSLLDEPKRKAVADAEAAVTAARTAFETAQKAATELVETYTKLTAVYPTTSTGRRLALAQWIASRNNPLTARVAINHIWLRHFHQPLVSTVFDFGMNGKPSIHPELLDWLATELMDNGWKMKPLHRLMVTSNAYRRASSPSAEARAMASGNTVLDPGNLQLWRQNSYRMEAEVVRDATLHVAGMLDKTMFGPDLDPDAGLTLGRRSVYFRTSKEKKMTFLSTFDSPNPVECYQRAESISPQQSLAMSNNPLTLAQSRTVAAKLSAQIALEPSENTVTQFVTLAFRHVLTRDPSVAELTECTGFIQQQSARFAVPGSLTVFAGGTENSVKPSGEASQRARENLIHVLFNHNDFVTVR